MKQTIKFLIIALVIIFIICLAVILVNNKEKNNTSNIENIDEPTPPEERYTNVKEKYECNEFEFVNVTTENLILMYFNKYKNDMLQDMEKAYNMLDSEYREKRFGDIKKYKEYIQENYEELSQISLASYKVNDDNSNYKEYICIDTNGNYYIFRETAIMQYTIILDTYTLDLPEFTEKYNSTNNQGKTALNIQKFMQAINAKDYNYAYNCLSDGFKNNYFKNVDEFEKYIKENFYQYNEYEYETFEEQGGLYKYQVKITNTENKTENITKTFVVKLNEGTDFEMSFNV